jgi:protein transport protein SEC31
LGKAGANPDEYTSLDWNKKVGHILATGSSGGFVTVWDVKQKKENLTLNNYGRKTVSAVSWDPDVPTRLVTAIPSDQHPLVLVWDLRNSNAPEKTLQAHDQGQPYDCMEPAHRRGPRRVSGRDQLDFPNSFPPLKPEHTGDRFL